MNVPNWILYHDGSVEPFYSQPGENIAVTASKLLGVDFGKPTKLRGRTYIVNGEKVVLMSAGVARGTLDACGLPQWLRKAHHNGPSLLARRPGSNAHHPQGPSYVHGTYDELLHHARRTLRQVDRLLAQHTTTWRLLSHADKIDILTEATDLTEWVYGVRGPAEPAEPAETEEPTRPQEVIAAILTERSMPR